MVKAECPQLRQSSEFDTPHADEQRKTESIENCRTIDFESRPDRGEVWGGYGADVCAITGEASCDFLNAVECDIAAGMGADYEFARDRCCRFYVLLTGSGLLCWV
ncbi:hypothetical protein AWENTII_002253 [Aspergillus wentii]